MTEDKDIAIARGFLLRSLGTVRQPLAEAYLRVMLEHAARRSAP